MMRLRLFLLAAATSLLLAGAAAAQEPIRFARMPDISPDGKLVAFSYLGDIWCVDAIGGVARPITTHQAHDMLPVFSPDGGQIAFSSNRHGSYDVFVAPVRGGRLGGKPRRLTFDSAHDLVCGWSPDGKNVLFTSTRSTSFPPALELYTIPADGSGSARRITAFEGKEGTYSPDGKKIAYVRGPGTWYRKGYRGSANDDIWICDADGSNNRQLTRFNGQDGSPMWAPDGKTLYYVSEFHGTAANLVKQDVDGQKPPQLVTFHKEDSVRRARISRDGEWIVYECGADLWIASTREGFPPRKLAIEVHADDKVNTEATLTFSRGASEFALNKTESHFVFAVHGELFLQKVAPRAKAVRLTDHPAYDHGAQFAPDSDKIVFLSDRNGHENLYLLTPDDPDHPKLVDAHRFKVKQITDSPDAKFGASFSPDGKRIVYVRAGKLVSINIDGSGEKVLVGDGQVIDYEWSPDSKWLAVAKMDGTFASEVYIIPSTGGETRNVTRYATFNGGITWSNNGQKLAFLSDRRQGGTSLFVMSLQKPAAPGAPTSKDIDWDDIHLRVEQPARLPIDEGAISPDGTKVAFRTTSFNGRGGSSDLWVATTDGQQLFRVTTGNRRPSQITWSKKPLDLLYFRDGEGKIRMARATPPSQSSSSISSSSLAEGIEVPFAVKMTVRRDEEYSEMFDQSWRALRENFYDKSFHGVDWNAVRGKYRPLVKNVAMKEDLQALISLMMGELNASHLGISSFGSSPEQTTADLGLLFDPTYRGLGLKIAEVVKRGPADKRGISLKPGDVLLAIDGKELSTAPNLSKLLNDKAKDTITLSVLSNPTADPKDPKARRKVEMQAVTRQEIQKLMYDRWVEANAKRVSELSKGTLGYIHIPSMDEAGLDQFVRALYSDNVGKDAIVLDVRYNGGGFTHDQVLNYLGGREHTLFRQRDGGAGPVLRSADRKWSKPLVLLINNRSYSDAEIFPHAFRALKLGKLVGQPTGAHVIGTSAVRLIDGSIFRIPRIGVFTDKGENMEKVGVMPDVPVDQTPDQFARGQDPQLDKAVEVVLRDVAVWKKNQGGGGVALKPDGAKPPMPVVGPVPPPGK